MINYKEHPSFKKYFFYIFISFFIAILILYESMAPTRLSSVNFGADGGDFLTAVIVHGIPHPSGYPLYLIISDLFQGINYNSNIWRQIQLSIIPGALSASIIFILTFIHMNGSNFLQQSIFSILSAFSIALAPIFWSQNVIIEVYGLNAFFICLALTWIYSITVFWKNQIKSNQVWICLLAWICGLGLGNHTTYLFIYPVVIFGLFKLMHSDMSKPLISLCAIGWFSGLFTYILLPIRAASHPPINWGDASTVQGFLWLISGGGYNNNIFSIQPTEYISRLSTWITLLFKQFGFFGLIAGTLGIFNTSMSKFFKWSTVYIFFVYTVFSIGYKTNDSLVYLIPALICFSIWIGWGLQYLWQYKVKSINWGACLSVIITINLCLVIPSRYEEVNPQNGDLSTYAETTLAHTPQNGMIYPTGDGETFALWYYHYGLRIRPDVIIISKGLLQYQWYRDQLQVQYPGIQIE